MQLTKKHRHFIEAYAGDVVEAMREAGFEGNPNYLQKQGENFLKNPVIREGIRQRSLYMASTTKMIATREERQAFWTSVMRNDDPHHIPEVNDKGVTRPKENIPLATRLKASELLGKSETDFIERVDVHHNLSISDVIKEAYTIPMENLDAIEAEYEKAYAIKNKTIEMQKEDVVDVTNDSDESDGDIVHESALEYFI